MLTEGSGLPEKYGMIFDDAQDEIKAEMNNEELFCHMCRERKPLSTEEGNNAVQMLRKELEEYHD